MIHVKLPVFINVDVQIDQLLGFVKILNRNSGEVDVSSCAIQLFEILKALPEPLLIEDLSGHQTQYRLDYGFVVLLSTGNFDVTNAVLIVFFDLDRDVVAIERLFLERNRDAPRERRTNKR